MPARGTRLARGMRGLRRAGAYLSVFGVGARCAVKIEQPTRIHIMATFVAIVLAMKARRSLLMAVLRATVDQSRRLVSLLAILLVR